jgi:hypothetical protein
MQPALAKIEYRGFRRGFLKNAGGGQAPALMRQDNRLGVRESVSPSNCLDSWKEIAAHLKRTVSTVQRWERNEGLPVHRHLHARASSVYARKSEIDVWWNRESDQKERGLPSLCRQTNSRKADASCSASIIGSVTRQGRSATLLFTPSQHLASEVTVIEICCIDEVTGRVTPLLQFQIRVTKCPVKENQAAAY